MGRFLVTPVYGGQYILTIHEDKVTFQNVGDTGIRLSALSPDTWRGAIADNMQKVLTGKNVTLAKTIERIEDDSEIETGIQVEQG